ncbi:MAG: murein biosynthesis integral membrane protein MurJ [Candidatus Yonathbacteria bacterium]|nr:murein biosynthesis integral membrane protein MurJ [Candidatus Yonathbacteria bacterium]NTW47368.1 murein biosynthesis integral membrane protein MurJ [Candidatus Yonathbacteria bacterium]
MVKRAFSFINKEFSGLHQAAYLLGAFAFISQILGLVRDRLLAHAFGAGPMLDAYYAAFRIPDLIFIGVSSFVSLTVLIPFLAGRLDAEGKATESADTFIRSVTSVFVVSVTLVCGATFFAMPILAPILAPGFTSEQMTLLISLSRILLLSPILLGLSNILGGITQTFRKFVVYAGAPVLYNLGIIIGIVLFLPYAGLSGVAWGVVFGAFLHVLIQLPVAIKEKLVPKWTLRPDINIIRDVVGLSLPRTVALSASQFVSAALVAVASTFTAGSVAVMTFAFNLQSVPLSIIGVSYSVAAFPTLARFFSSGDTKLFARHMMTAARHIILWSLPAIVLFVMLRAQIVRVVLGSGGFDWTDTRLTAAALAVFVVSVLAQSLQLLFVRGYYAAGKTKTPLVINLVFSGITIVLVGILSQSFSPTEGWGEVMVHLLKIADLPGTEIVVLPLAYTLGMIGNAVALWIFFDKDFYEFSLRAERAFVEVAGASFVMGVVAYHLLNAIAPHIDMETFSGVFLQGAGAGIGGILAGICVLLIIGNKEIREIGGAFHTHIGHVRPVGAEKEEI